MTQSGGFLWIITIIIITKHLRMFESHTVLPARCFLVSALCRASNYWTCSHGIKPAEATCKSSWTPLQFEGYMF